ncbi:hypothetical protein [Cohnella terricola]|uniref:Uncharacterized protein n=1 Tax=Cohnella terricola TaxID=1289167 RepID=A0A559JX70_9BACL|nr:hypothetical protein [Cohnella terricola]TVY04483.1 hypothetical protein FPZ45_02580 [Cohnella terricola]
MNDYAKRVSALKSFEVLCYSLCIHLLTEEVLAVHAAQAALLDLFADEQFWRLEDDERTKRVRRRAIARSMELLSRSKES